MVQVGVYMLPYLALGDHGTVPLFYVTDKVPLYPLPWYPSQRPPVSLILIIQTSSRLLSLLLPCDGIVSHEGGFSSHVRERFLSLLHRALRL